MKDINEIRDYLIKHRTDKNGNLDLSDLDFEKIKGKVMLTRMKAKDIDNSFQKADNISNAYQQAKEKINNSSQEAKEKIYNQSQEAKEIYNKCQEADKISNSRQEAKEKIDNTFQELSLIHI